MKKILAFVLLLGFFLSISPVFAAVRVNGYYRKNGTYVAPHYRSNPDGVKSNNYSYPGNTNPYTGVTAPSSRSYYPVSLPEPIYADYPYCLTSLYLTCRTTTTVQTPVLQKGNFSCAGKTYTCSSNSYLICNGGSPYCKNY